MEIDDFKGEVSRTFRNTAFIEGASHEYPFHFSHGSNATVDTTRESQA
jgi:hypothetical protein